MQKGFKDECDAIEENCTYTSETHHVIAAKSKRVLFWSQVLPAIITAVLAALVGTNFTFGVSEDTFIWLILISAVITAVANVLNPLATYHDHLQAAKNFITLKQDARALNETYGKELKDEEFAREVKILHNRYNDIVRFAPPTDNESFEEARKRVKSGVHKRDKN